MGFSMDYHKYRLDIFTTNSKPDGYGERIVKFKTTLAIEELEKMWWDVPYLEIELNTLTGQGRLTFKSGRVAEALRPLIEETLEMSNQVEAFLGETSPMRNNKIWLYEK